MTIMPRRGTGGRRRTFLVVGVLLLSTGMLQAGGRPTDHGQPVIRLGALITQSETGDPDTQAAIRLATDDVNAYFARGGPGPAGRPRSRALLTVEGTGLDPEVALNSIGHLERRGLRVVIGPESSAEVEAVAAFADANGVVLLSHCSAAPSLAIPGDNVYRLVPSDLHQAGAIARLIADGGFRAIVPLWRAGVWGDDIAAAAAQGFTALGGTVYSGVRFDPGQSDFAADLAALHEQVAEAQASFGDDVAVAFFSFGTEGAAVLAQAADVPALGAVTWYGSDGTALSREILGDPQAARFAIRTGFLNTLFADVHTPLAMAVRERIAAAIGGGGVHFCSTAAYDAVWLAALAAAAAGTDDAERFKRALTEIAATFVGATGPTTLDAAGDRAAAAYDVWAIQEQDGEYAWVLMAPGLTP